MLAGALWIVWILARAPHLARTTRVAACGRCQTAPKAGEGRGEDGLCDWRLAKKREDMVSSATARAAKRPQHGKAGAAQKTVMERGGCGVRDGCGGEGCGEGTIGDGLKGAGKHRGKGDRLSLDLAVFGRIVGSGVVRRGCGRVGFFFCTSGGHRRGKWERGRDGRGLRSAGEALAARGRNAMADCGGGRSGAGQAARGRQGGAGDAGQQANKYPREPRP